MKSSQLGLKMFLALVWVVGSAIVPGRITFSVGLGLVWAAKSQHDLSSLVALTMAGIFTEPDAHCARTIT